MMRTKLTVATATLIQTRENSQLPFVVLIGDASFGRRFLLCVHRLEGSAAEDVENLCGVLAGSFISPTTLSFSVEYSICLVSSDTQISPQ